MQDFQQDKLYYSDSTGKSIPIATMPCPVAQRAYAKLERTQGYAILETPLARALHARAELGVGAEAVEFGGRMMIRDKDSKKFRAGTTRLSR